MATPLSTKLGLKPGWRVQLVGAPDDLDCRLGPLPHDCTLEHFAFFDGFGEDDFPLTCCLLFAPEQSLFMAVFEHLVTRVGPETVLWLCWPKKSGPMDSDLSFNIIQQAALSRGLVDNKVCSVDGTWSALRCTVRKELRATWNSAKH